MNSEQEIIHSAATNTILAPNEPTAFRKIVHDTNVPIILCCDHASNRVPESLSQLGLADEYLQEHIAWDIGAAKLTERLAEKLNCTALLNNYSRLVVDCNRYLSDPSAFAQKSDTLVVPGNVELHEMEKAARAEAIYYSYHRSIRKVLETFDVGVRTPVLISIHSFTKQLRGKPERDIDVGVLWDKDPRIPLPLLDFLREQGDLVVGDNEPYSGRDIADYTVDHHAETKGYAYVSLEVRNDLISDEQGVERWANLLAQAFEKILADKNIFTRFKAESKND